jgi:beta-lactamase class A
MKKAAAPRLALALAAAWVLLASSPFLHGQYVAPQEPGPAPAKWAQLEKDVAASLRDFQGVLGYVIKDLESGRILTRLPDRRFPSASMVKVPIMAACYQAAEDGRISLHDTLKLKRSDKVRGSGVLRGAATGTPVTVEKLLELMITDSDNTAANMLINLLGFEYLGNTFHGFGLDATNLSRRMMDFQSRARGVENYTTPREMALILEKIYRRTCVSPQVSDQCLDLLKRQKVNNRIPRYLPRRVVVAHKTGLEHKVCHDAGIVYTAKGDVLISVLTEGDTGAVIAERMIGRIAKCVYKAYTP